MTAPPTVRQLYDIIRTATVAKRAAAAVLRDPDDEALDAALAEAEKACHAAVEAAGWSWEEFVAEVDEADPGGAGQNGRPDPNE